MIKKSSGISKSENSQTYKPFIGIAGLTHLGLNTAVSSAAHGFDVVGFHNDLKLVNQLSIGNLHIIEPGLPELLIENRDRITFSADSESLALCDIIYIAVDVPTDDQGSSDLSPIFQMIRVATEVMKPDALLVILCQVPPGFTRQINWPSTQLYYQVETLVFGRAVERAMHPERFIIGCSNAELPVDERLLKYLNSYDCPILPMGYESAELAKISINMFLVASVSTANTLAEICENIGADWSEIVPALRLDARIGQYAYLSPGLGISGGNLERDLATILRYAEKYKTDGGVVASWVRNSHYRKDWAWSTFVNLGLDKNTELHISVLGLTYKENTHSLKNSPSLIFLSHLSNYKIVAYDPVATYEDTSSSFLRVNSVYEAIKEADVLAILTPWPEFKFLKSEEIIKRMKGNIILDPFRMLERNDYINAGFTYASLGKPINIELKGGK